VLPLICLSLLLLPALVLGVPVPKGGRSGAGGSKKGGSAKGIEVGTIIGYIVAGIAFLCFACWTTFCICITRGIKTPSVHYESQAEEEEEEEEEQEEQEEEEEENIVKENEAGSLDREGSR